MMDFRIANLNSYLYNSAQVYNNKVCVNRNVSFSGESDTFISSVKNKVKNITGGLSDNAKWGLGTLALVGIGAVAFLITRGRVGRKSAQQLAEYINFKPATTIEDARGFANKILKVQYLDEDKANLDMINTVNEWLHNEKIVLKNCIPDFVHFKEMGIYNPLCLTDKVYYNGVGHNSLGINVNYINRFDDFLNGVFKPHGDVDLSKLIRKNSKNEYEITKNEYHCENLGKLIDKLNSYGKNSSYKDKMELFDGLSEAISYLNDISAGNSVKMNAFSHNGSFLHELGHLLHQDSSKLYTELGKTTNRMHQEFQQSDIQKVANKVSAYAKSSPLEFVAEVYKKHRRGVKFDRDVLDLYAKYSGPILT